jgi:hypothetical protein
MGDRSLGQVEQDGLFAADPAELADKLVFDPLVGPGVDAVDRGDEQLHQRVGDLPLPADQQRRQQRQPKRGRVGAQVRRRLDRRPGPPCGHHLGGHVGEQARRQADRPDRDEPLDLAEHRVQADIPRVSLDEPQRQGVPLSVLAAVFPGPVGRDQRQRPGRGVRRHSGGDPRAQRLLGLAQRRGHDPLGPPRRRRLDALHPATRRQLLGQQFRATLRLGHILGQPPSELVGVFDRAFPEPQHGTDLGPVTLDRAARPLVQVEVTGRHRQLPGHVLDRVLGYLRRANEGSGRWAKNLSSRENPSWLSLALACTSTSSSGSSVHRSTSSSGSIG